MLLKVELHHLRHFIALADELHFGKAAARLHIAQPALSQSIKRLEDGLGVRLLNRTRRAVTLTAAGKVLLQEARQIVAHAERAESMTRRAAATELPPLRVGFAPWTLERGLPLALQEFHKQWPGAEVQLEERRSKVQVEALRNGSLDLGVINVGVAGTDGLSVRIVQRSRLVVAMPSAWPLAREKSIRLADLGEYPFVAFTDTESSSLSATVKEIFHNAGVVPNITQRAAQPDTLLKLIASGLGIALVSEAASYTKPEGVSLIALSDLPAQCHLEIALAWVPQSATPILKNFISLLEQAAERVEQD